MTRSTIIFWLALGGGWAVGTYLAVRPVLQWAATDAAAPTPVLAFSR